LLLEAKLFTLSWFLG